MGLDRPRRICLACHALDPPTESAYGCSNCGEAATLSQLGGAVPEVCPWCGDGKLELMTEDACAECGQGMVEEREVYTCPTAGASTSTDGSTTTAPTAPGWNTDHPGLRRVGQRGPRARWPISAPGMQGQGRSGSGWMGVSALAGASW